MHEVMDWIDKEVERLDLIIEGKAVDKLPEVIPVLLKDALRDYV